jgi:hypothetical protein
MAEWTESLGGAAEPRSRSRATLLILAFLCAGYAMSERLGDALRLDADAVVDSFEAHRLVTYAWIFDTERGAGFNLLYFVALAILFGGFCRRAEESLGPVRTMSAFLLLPAAGGIALAFWQRVTGSFEFGAGDAMPGSAAVILLAGCAESARRVRLFFFLPTRMSTATILALAIPFAYVTAVHRSAAALLPLAATLAAAWAAVRIRPLAGAVLHRLTRRLERAREGRDVEMRRQVDAILDKIHHTGLGSLSRVERRTLHRASRRLQETRER